jgi:hypothetical protein
VFRLSARARRKLSRLFAAAVVNGTVIGLLVIGVAGWLVVHRGQPAAVPELVALTVGWDASPDPRVVGYQVLFGTEPRKYSDLVAVGTETTATLTTLRKGTRYYLVAVAVDAEGNRSLPSNEIEVVSPE